MPGRRRSLAAGQHLHVIRRDQARLPLEGAQNLYPFDKVDSQIGLQVHIQAKHLHGITGALTDQPQEDLAHGFRRHFG